MFTMTAKWNQPCRSIAGAATLYLGVRIAVPPSTPRRAVYGVVLLDVSRSMEGEKLAAARQAVQTLWSQLRSGDRLAVVLFSDSSRLLMPWTEKGTATDERIAELLESCRAAGATNLQVGLTEALLLARESPSHAARFVWLITDGTPTDGTGKVAPGPEPFLDEAARAAAEGVTVGAIGLGSAQNFQADFLRELSDRGRGSFHYAATSELLSPQLRAQLTAAQRVVAPNMTLELELVAGNQLLSAARVVPEYVPMDASGGRGRWSVAAGAVAEPETVLLLEVATAAPFLCDAGEHKIGTLHLNPTGSAAQGAAPLELHLRYQRPGSPDLLDRDPFVEGLRYTMLLVRNEALRRRAQSPSEKLRSTEIMIDLVRKTGDAAVLKELQAEAEQLRHDRVLTADQEARTMQDIRATSSAVYRSHQQGRKEGGNGS